MGILVYLHESEMNSSFVSVFLAYELIFCAFVPVLSTVSHLYILSLFLCRIFCVESRLVCIHLKAFLFRRDGGNKEK